MSGSNPENLDPSTKAPGAHPVQVVGTTTASILIVENDKELLEILRYVLEEEGHKVFTAAGGPEALASFSAEPIDLVVVDTARIGSELVRALRSHERTASVMIMVHTASPETAVRIDFDDYDAYLRKVDDSAVFVRVVSEILGAKAKPNSIALDKAGAGTAGQR